MATFCPDIETRTCGTCSSVYELRWLRLSKRDQGTIECQVCGTPLVSWNGGTTCSAKLMKRGTPAAGAGR